MRTKIEIFEQQDEEDIEEFQNRINEYLDIPGVSYVDLKICTERYGTSDFSKYILVYNEMDIEPTRASKGKKCQ